VCATRWLGPSGGLTGDAEQSHRLDDVLVQMCALPLGLTERHLERSKQATGD
jgi:hypothetical protein